LTGQPLSDAAVDAKPWRIGEAEAGKQRLD
jgi:hypothetical protein